MSDAAIIWVSVGSLIVSALALVLGISNLIHFMRLYKS
jgi:hypothetical protein